MGIGLGCRGLGVNLWISVLGNPSFEGPRDLPLEFPVTLILGAFPVGAQFSLNFLVGAPFCVHRGFFSQIFATFNGSPMGALLSFFGFWPPHIRGVYRGDTFFSKALKVLEQRQGNLWSQKTVGALSVLALKCHQQR